MANELAVVEQGQGEIVVAGDKSPKATRTRAQILAPLGITDDATKSLAAVIKGYLKTKGMTAKDVQAEYFRILREDTHGAVLAKMEWAKANGYALEYKSMKDGKDGEKFAVNFIPPKTPKRLTASEQDKMFNLVGGKDSAMGKQLWEHLQKGNMLAQPKTVNAEAEVVS